MIELPGGLVAAGQMYDGITVLVSLHQVEYALSYCPRTIALREGRVVYDGPSTALTPGFLSDVLAFLLLIPPLRHGIARWGVKRLVQRALAPDARPDARIGRAPRASGAHGRQSQGPVIEGEVVRSR